HSSIFKIQNTDSTNTTFGFNFGTYSDGGSNRYLELGGFNTTGNVFTGTWAFNNTAVFSAGIQSNYWQDFNIYHINSNAGQAIKFWSLGPTGSGGVIVSFVNTGNVLIGTTTDSGYRLDVNGTARINSSLYVTDPSYTGSGRFYQAGNSTTVISGGPAGENITFGPSNRIFINASMTRVSSVLQTAAQLSVGTFNYPWTYGAQAYISGSTTANAGGGRGLYIDSTIVAAANNDVLIGLDINPTFTNGAFTGVTNYALRLGNNQNMLLQGEGMILHNSGSSRILAGRDAAAVYFGYNFGSQQIHIGSVGSGNILFRSSGNVCLENANSNLLVGTTTDSGYKLDVNGITRLQ
ncbi:hypothetical protein EBT25_18795, partial [bacterium]|nr:hypothetical protein [bacterium]